ncbi:MAG: hypothetical protein ACK4PC_01995 [Sphingopyxis sp.]
MRLSIVLAIELMPTAVHAQFAPRTPPPSDRMPGISDMAATTDRSTVGHDLRETRKRISNGRDSGQLSKREARAFRREARQISAQADRYARDGVSDSERRELDMRLQVLRDLTAAQRLRINKP